MAQTSPSVEPREMPCGSPGASPSGGACGATSPQSASGLPREQRNSRNSHASQGIAMDGRGYEELLA
jgi:hypothetical protein